MNTLKDDDVIINLKLLKQCHFHQIVCPGGRMIFGWDIHQLCYIVGLVIVQCCSIYGNLGLFFNDEDIDMKTDYFLLSCVMLNIQLSFCRFIVFMYNGNKISDMFIGTRLDFFTSKHCVNYKNTLYSYRDKLRKFSNWFVIFFSVNIVQWFIFPIVINMYTTSDNSSVRLENIVNLNFGVSTQTYNQYFVIFYSIEAFVIFFAMYSYLMTDLLLISFCCALMSQQQVLVQAFKNFGHEDNPQSNYFEEFKSILRDQVKLNLKIKSLFLVVKHIVLLAVACDSASIILLTYRFIMVYLKMGPVMALTLLKVGSTIFYVSLQLFIYCYLFEIMNTQRELVNLSIYSSNWTQIDLKFKKLALLAMRMNDANNLVIKASPKKIINLQIFASIMSMSYNVISVMLKTTNAQNEISEQS